MLKVVGGAGVTARAASFALLLCPALPHAGSEVDWCTLLLQVNRSRRVSVHVDPTADADWLSSGYKYAHTLALWARAYLRCTNNAKPGACRFAHGLLHQALSKARLNDSAKYRPPNKQAVYTLPPLPLHCLRLTFIRLRDSKSPIS